MRILDEWRILRSRLLHGKGKAQKADARPSVPLAENVVARARPDDSIRWMPRQRGMLSKVGPYSAGAVALFGALGAGAWLLTPPATLTSATLEQQRTDPSPRLEQITAAVRAPLLSSEEDVAKASVSRVPSLAVMEQGLAVEAGARAKLSARVGNEDALEPETVALVSGLPAEAELSEGIRIGPKLWMLRPSLLGTAEIDAGRSPAGRHDLTVELRGPTGSIIASAQTTLEITQSSVEAQVTPSAAVIEAETASKAAPTGNAPVARKSAKRRERYAAPAVVPVEAPRPRVKARSSPAATVREQTGTPRETREIRSTSQPGTRVLSSSPAIPQTPQGQRMVWPGDDPRAAYTQSPPIFLGGPGVQPRSAPQVEREDPNWQKRAFGE